MKCTLNKNTHLRKTKPVKVFSMGHYYTGTKIISSVKRPIGTFEADCYLVDAGAMPRKNAKTVIVQLRDGNIIKRHIAKHGVV